MKVVIVGGTGLIGRKLAAKLESCGHQVVAASPSTGLAGPEASGMAEFIQRFLSSVGDKRNVVPDPGEKYFGAVLDKDGLAPTGQFIAGRIRFTDWKRAQS